MRIAYVRVSTEEQNEARQREALKQYRIEKWFCEKRSAKEYESPAVGGNVGVCQKRRYHLYS